MPHRIELQRVDITTLAVDAIVSASNPSLVPGGTVSAAVHRVAGPELLAACMQYPGQRAGKAVITPGFGLPARYVVHAIGPGWWPGKVPEEQKLRSAYRASYALIAEHDLRTIAFSAISCGFYRYPLEEAAAIAMSETLNALRENDRIEKLIFALMADNVYAAFEAALQTVRTPAPLPAEAKNP